MRRATTFSLTALFLIAGAAVLAWPAARAEEDAAAVPEGSPAELRKLIEEVQELRTDASSPEGVRKFVRETRPKVITAAEKLLADDSIDDEMRRFASLAKIESLVLMILIDEPQASQRMQTFADQLREKGEENIAEMAELQGLQALVLGMEMLEEDKQAGRFTQIKESLAERPKDRQHISVAMRAIRMLEMLDDDQLASQAYREFGKLYAGSDDPQVAEAASRFENSARRLSLVGSPFVAFAGPNTAGEKFDSSTHVGKVVLIDFWATWCGPCVAELPNVKRAYETYHEQGFEVVGVSLDDDRGALDKFLEDNELPWPTLIGSEAIAAGSEEALADYYGISAIPTVILVGRDGKVLSINARGSILNSKLAELFGDVGKEG